MALRDESAAMKARVEARREARREANRFADGLLARFATVATLLERETK
jgi:hypothetical protein